MLIYFGCYYYWGIRNGIVIDIEEAVSEGSFSLKLPKKIDLVFDGL